MTSFPVQKGLFPINPGQFSKVRISLALYAKFQPLLKKLREDSIWTSTNLKDPLSYISKHVRNSLFLSLPNAHEISNIISKHDVNKSSPGSHGLNSNKVIKVTNEVISPYLEVLFHVSKESNVSKRAFSQIFQNS